MMLIFDERPLYAYIANFTARQTSLPTFVIVFCALNAPKYIVNARNDEKYVFKDEGHVLTQGNKSRTDATVNAVCKTSPERHKEQ